MMIYSVFHSLYLIMILCLKMFYVFQMQEQLRVYKEEISKKDRLIGQLTRYDCQNLPYVKTAYAALLPPFGVSLFSCANSIFYIP